MGKCCDINIIKVVLSRIHSKRVSMYSLFIIFDFAYPLRIFVSRYLTFQFNFLLKSSILVAKITSHIFLLFLLGLLGNACLGAFT